MGRICAAWRTIEEVRLEYRSICSAIDRISEEIADNVNLAPCSYFERLLIAGEDHRFHGHCGVDPFALTGALFSCIAGKPRGGSTIAMQIVRTLSDRREKTVSRKCREMILATLITRVEGREYLPTIYLWVAYYGWKMNSFTEACTYLKIQPLTPSSFEAAALIARLKYPQPKEVGSRRAEQIRARALYLIDLEAKLR